MNDKISKKEFNKQMKLLDIEEKTLDNSMSKYYNKPKVTIENVVFQLSLILLNVVFWVLLYLYLVNTKGVDFKLDKININNLPIFIVFLALGIVLCKWLANIFVVKQNSKYVRPIVSLRLVNKNSLYTKLGYSSFVVNEYTLTKSRIETFTATTIDSVMHIGNAVFNVISSIVFSVSFLFFVIESTIIVAVINIIATIILIALSIVIMIILLNDNQLSLVVFRLSKLMFVLKLVNDFDYTYKLLSLKVLNLSRVVKNIKSHISSILVLFVSNMFVLILKSLVIYVLLSIFVKVDVKDFIQVLVFVSVINNISSLDLFKNKFIVKELVVLSLFSIYSLGEYTFIFTILYIMLDYYLPLVLNIVIDLIDRVVFFKTESYFNKGVSNRKLKSRLNNIKNK